MPWSHVPFHESRHTDDWFISHIWMSHVTREWAMSHIWMRHVTQVLVFVVDIAGRKGLYMSHVTHERAMSHIWVRHVTHTTQVLVFVVDIAGSEGRDPMHDLMSHVTLMIESHRTYKWVMSHMNESHATHMNASCHTGASVRSGHSR